MSVFTTIRDRLGKYAARVTSLGQLVVAPYDYSEPVSKSLDSINTAFNFIEPLAGHAIVITDIIASADKDVSNTTPADVDVYESDAVDSLTSIKGIVRPQLARSAGRDLIGLNLLVPTGFWVNAKTTDATILLTIMFYRVPV